MGGVFRFFGLVGLGLGWGLGIILGEVVGFVFEEVGVLVRSVGEYFYFYIWKRG